MTIANTLKSTLASAQKQIGKTLGNETMVAKGTVNKAKAEASKLSEEVQQTARDMGQKIKGRAERTAGAATGDKTLENKGRAHEAQSKS
ncbi:hypothetical protein DFQ27_000883 [Actinomortierella ambigua]|uniref:CsbD family protein n=1 Tax=Actinomortierella ambigua TaxID=1343610 RepID=A0A9P6QBM8_9FUNG|nr:hypothetical protein DFQ27_000883 [Actinomortierella ambigua]